VALIPGFFQSADPALGAAVTNIGRRIQPGASFPLIEAADMEAEFAATAGGAFAIFLAAKMLLITGAAMDAIIKRRAISAGLFKKAVPQDFAGNRGNAPLQIFCKGAQGLAGLESLFNGISFLFRKSLIGVVVHQIPSFQTRRLATRTEYTKTRQWEQENREKRTDRPDGLDRPAHQAHLILPPGWQSRSGCIFSPLTSCLVKKSPHLPLTGKGLWACGREHA